MITTRYSSPSMFASRTVSVLPHVRAVVRDEQNRDVGQRERDNREDHRVLGQHHGVDAGHDDRHRQHEQHDPRECKARRPVWMPVAAPLPTAELGQVVGAGEDRVDRGTPDRERIPTSPRTSPIRPSGCSAPSAIVPRCSGEIPRVRKSAPPTIISASERNPPSP